MITIELSDVALETLHNTGTVVVIAEAADGYSNSSIVGIDSIEEFFEKFPSIERPKKIEGKEENERTKPVFEACVNGREVLTLRLSSKSCFDDDPGHCLCCSWDEINFEKI